VNGNMFKRRGAVQEQFPESKCKTQDISKVRVCFDVEELTQIIIFGMRYVIRSLYLSRIHFLSSTLMALPTTEVRITSLF